MIFTGDIAQPYLGASEYLIPTELTQKTWFGNLEGSLIDEKKQKTTPKGVYNNVRAIEDLKKHIPFQAFGIANNHLLDAAGVKTTLDNLQQMDAGVVGAGCNLKEANKSVLVTDEEGNTYRIIAFGWDNIQCKLAKNNKQGVNPYTKANVMGCVKDALKCGEPVVCFMHWNYELEAYPQPYDRQLALELIDIGVRAVIGCHAHRTQPVEFYKGKPIVYGLGNFLFCQGHYFGGKLIFPKFCEEEYAIELTRGGFWLHYFKYNQQGNKLEFRESEEISEQKEFDGKATFSGMTASDYEIWFKKNRVQKKLLPIFHTKESSISYAVKSLWIKVRGGLINFLMKINLKSANRVK